MSTVPSNYISIPFHKDYVLSLLMFLLFVGGGRIAWDRKKNKADAEEEDEKQY